MTVLSCRDALKKRVEELLAELSQGAPAEEVTVPSATALNFFGKISATVGTSEEAASTQTQALPTTALRNGWTGSPAGTISRWGNGQGKLGPAVRNGWTSSTAGTIAVGW